MRVKNGIRFNFKLLHSNFHFYELSKTIIQFLHIVLGSIGELDTQLIIAKEVKLAAPEFFDPVLEEVDRMQGILVSTIQKLKS